VEQRATVTVKDAIFFSIAPDHVAGHVEPDSWICCEKHVFATLGTPISRGTESSNPLPSSG
jgi:hypothetical protein